MGLLEQCSETLIAEYISVFSKSQCPVGEQDGKIALMFVIGRGQNALKKKCKSLDTFPVPDRGYNGNGGMIKLIISCSEMVCRIL